MSKKLIFGLLGAGLMVVGGPAFAASRGDDGASRAVVTVRVQDDGYDRYDGSRWNDDSRYDADKTRGDNRRYDDDRGHRGGPSRGVSRKVIKTRYRADIIVTERLAPGRRGGDRICTVSARGPEARRISTRQLRSAAKRNCSRRSDIRII